MSKHTPGPWFVAENNGAHTFVRSDTPETKSQTIAQVWNIDSDFRTSNAHLISVAPAMLELLEMVSDVLDEYPASTDKTIEFEKKVFNVIKKAKGF